jgi:hypothetical protein
MDKSMTAATPGILAIFNNVAPGREGEFERWFQHEHLAERLAVPGFRLGRRYEAVAAAPRFFNFYLTQSVEVLTSPAYLARLNDPTPLTRTVMAEIFRDMIRTLCRLSFRAGVLRGSTAVTVRFAEAPDDTALRATIETLIQDVAVSCGEIWSAVFTGMPMAEEERLRGGDRRIAACLFIETLRVPEAERIAAMLSGTFPRAAVGTYRLLCEIQA